MAATGDRVPCVYVRDHRVVGLDPADPIEVRYGEPIDGEPTGKADPELLRLHPSHGHDMAIVDGISRIGYMKGGKAALWKDENMADTFTREAVEFIERHKARAVLPLLRHPRHPRPARAAPAVRRQERDGPAGRRDRRVRLVGRRGAQVPRRERAGREHAGDLHQRQRPGRRRRLSRRRRREARATTSRPAPIAAASTASSRAAPASPSSSAGRGGSSPGPRRRSSARSTSSRASRPWSASRTRVASVPDSRNHLAALLGDDPVGRESLIEHAGGLALRRGRVEVHPGLEWPEETTARPTPSSATTRHRSFTTSTPIPARPATWPRITPRSSRGFVRI